MKTTITLPSRSEASTVLPTATATQPEPHFTIVQVPDVVNATAGIPFQVQVTIKNDGDATGKYMVELYNADNHKVDYKESQLDAGAQETQTLTATENNPGKYIYTVKVYNEDTQNYDDSKTVEVDVTAPATKTTKTEEGFGWGWVILLIILLLIGLAGRRE